MKKWIVAAASVCGVGRCVRFAADRIAGTGAAAAGQKKDAAAPAEPAKVTGKQLRPRPHRLPPRPAPTPNKG